MICQYRFTDCKKKKCTTLVKDADSEESVHVWEQETYEKTLNFSIRFSVSEVSQKEKHQYCILTHIYGI